MAKTEWIEDLPSNSKSSKSAPIRERKTRKSRVEIIDPEPKPRTNMAPRAQGIRRKKTLAQSVAEAFVGDTTQNVGAHILYEVLLPAAKETIQSMVTTGIEMLLFGEARPKSRDRDRGTRVSYGSYYKGERDREDRRPRPTRGDKFDLNDIYFRHGDEADQVLESLQEALEDYEAVTVRDYFDAAGISGATWIHEKWGWDDLSRAYCTHTRNGYVIVFPPPIELED